MSTKKLAKKAEKLLGQYRKKNLKIATAESCTGGMIAALITDIAGSSDVFERGFVTYSNDSKKEMLGVDAALITKHGAVSAEVAQAMARGAIKRSKADVAIAVTGVAGPSGGTKAKPVGLVFIAAASKHYAEAIVIKNNFTGKRHAVREKTTDKALTVLSKLQAFF
jgi:nicotinamide-nucleotide amidase